MHCPSMYVQLKRITVNVILVAYNVGLYKLNLLGSLAFIPGYDPMLVVLPWVPYLSLT